MGMDGLSMANTGVVKESTSADFTSKTEQAMQADPTNDFKQVQNVNNNHRVREKEEDEESPKRHSQENAKQEQEENEEFDDAFEQTSSKTKNSDKDYDVEDLENPNNDFYVKLNAKDDIIELYDSSTGRLIENISGQELQELVKKLNTVSGIFVNKKV